MRHLVLLLAFSPLAAWCQKPVIFSSGAVNAASYQPENGQPGTIVSIFGQNLAASAQQATAVPLPTQLAGTSVSVNGVPAPLFYVSPGQINLQVPTVYSPITSTGIVVSTATGTSDSYQAPKTATQAIGIFTRDGSGCRQAAVMNVASDGTESPNSSSNSVSPGDYIAIYATGLGPDILIYTAPPDGTPTPLAPLTRLAGGGATDFEFLRTSPAWAGRAPALIGVDQINVQVPTTTREGCAIPLQVEGGGGIGISQPVTISVRKGGGSCVDPPPAGYGQILWEKTITEPLPPASSTETNTVTVSLQAAPGQQTPAPPAYSEQWGYLAIDNFGPSCPVPGYRSLGAGAISAQGSGFSSVQASSLAAQPADLRRGPEVPGGNPPIAAGGLTIYRATLPSGAIQSGSFTVAATGGADVGAFQSSVQIGSGIDVTTPLTGRVFPSNQPLTINWTGGDANAWVTFRLVFHGAGYDKAQVQRARASAGSVTMPTGNGYLGVSGLAEIILEVTPDPSQIPTFSAPGLSLGGQHTWKYTYRFEGLQIL